MPRTKAAPTAAEYAVLGVLREAPAHGYRLAQNFAPSQGLGLLYPLEQSTVYGLLHELEARGLIAGQQESIGPRPPRTLFSLTTAGDAYLQDWLAVPIEPLHRLRLDFLLKLYFTTRHDPNSAAGLIAAQLTVGERYIADLDAELSHLDVDSLEYLILESKRAAVDSFIAWLRSRNERIRALRESLTSLV